MLHSHLCILQRCRQSETAARESRKNSTGLAKPKRQQILLRLPLKQLLVPAFGSLRGTLQTLLVTDFPRESRQFRGHGARYVVVLLVVILIRLVQIRGSSVVL